MEQTANLPLTSIGYKGSGTPNGVPVNRTNAGYKTLGGIVDSSDSNNTSNVAYFGNVVSSDPSGVEGNFALGQPSGYYARGILMFDAAIAQNDPAKSNYYLQDTPATVIYEGTVQMSSWTATQSGALTSSTITLGAVPIYRATSAGTGAAPIGQIEFLPAGTLSNAIPTGWASLPGYVVEITANAGVRLEVSFNTEALASPPASPFIYSATLTSAAAATPVHIVTDAQVGTGKKLYLTGAVLKVNGATAWTDVTATIVKVQDTNGTPVVGLTYAKAGLTGNAIFSSLSGSNLTTGSAVALGSGFTTSKGIDIVADANFAAGSDIVITVSGFIQ